MNATVLPSPRPVPHRHEPTDPPHERHRPAAPARAAGRLRPPRSLLRRHLRHRGQDHGHLLPARLPGEEAEAGERRVLPHLPRRPVRRLPAVQALPAARARRQPAPVAARGARRDRARPGPPLARPGPARPRPRARPGAALVPEAPRHDLPRLHPCPPPGRSPWHHPERRQGDRRRLRPRLRLPLRLQRGLPAPHRRAHRRRGRRPAGARHPPAHAARSHDRGGHRRGPLACSSSPTGACCPANSGA